jgi:hypothetical protein
LWASARVRVLYGGRSYLSALFDDILEDDINDFYG